MSDANRVLPNLGDLNPTELKALIVSQHELIVSRDSGIEQLKLWIAKLRRMQFGPSSEKLDRRIEQLELRLEALQYTGALSSPPVRPRRKNSARILFPRTVRRWLSDRTGFRGPEQ